MNLNKEKVNLDAQRKNIQLAADEINKALSYIFFSDHRLEVSLGSGYIDECWREAMAHSDTQLKTAPRPAKPTK